MSISVPTIVENYPSDVRGARLNVGDIVYVVIRINSSEFKSFISTIHRIEIARNMKQYMIGINHEYLTFVIHNDCLKIN